MRLAFVIPFLLVVTALPATGTIYKIVDANGKVHYSDTPPTDRSKVTTMTIRQAPPSAPAAQSVPSWQDKERAFQQRQALEKFGQSEKSSAPNRQQLCIAARSRLAELTGHRVYRINKDGEMVFMEDDERAAIEAEANKTIAENCN